MTNEIEVIQALRMERDELRDDLLRLRGAIAWVISDIERQQHFDPNFPEHLSRWMEKDILRRLRAAVGWLPERGEQSPG
jgi:hypothetical protein